jgi:hypothetical protein
MDHPTEDQTMATATTRKPGSSGKPSKLAVSLALSIDHQVYTLDPLRSEDTEITRGWRLTAKSSGNVYDVAQTAQGITCDCPDQAYRHEGRDDIGCKHIQALRLMGLLDAVPIPGPDPTTARPCGPSGEPAPSPQCQMSPRPTTR